MAELTNPHDRFFKDALSRPAARRDFLQYYLLPAIAECLDHIAGFRPKLKL